MEKIGSAKVLKLISDVSYKRGEFEGMLLGIIHQLVLNQGQLVDWANKHRKEHDKPQVRWTHGPFVKEESKDTEPS